MSKKLFKIKHIEIIDDGSKDDTYKIVEELAKGDNRIKLYRNDSALSLSSGEYILRMDGDDISVFDRIENKVKFLEENQEFDLVGCSMKAIDTAGKNIGQTIQIKIFF